MTRADKVLVLFLRVVGVGSLFALVPVFMPFAWMADTHRWLGLGEMPTGSAEPRAVPPPVLP
jgi:hypothetical protein